MNVDLVTLTDTDMKFNLTKCIFKFKYLILLQQIEIINND